MKKLLALLVVISGIPTALGFSLTFNGFSQNDPIQNKFSLVHFTLPDTSTNNYQGSFFWLPSQQDQQTITFNGSSKTCSKQVRGLYYSNAKGARLWPLDSQSLAGLKLLNSDYNDLQIEGGIYTTCGTSGSVDIYSLYGNITYRSSQGPLGSLSAGLAYDAMTNSVKTSAGLYPSLQYFNNQTPLGYIYDTVAGIGFVGGELPVAAHQGILEQIHPGGKSINEIFGFGNNGGISTTIGGVEYPLNTGSNTAGLDTLWNISVLGNVLLSRGGLDVVDRQSVLGNPSLTSSVVFSDIVNTSDILNTLRKNSDSLCRGQKIHTQAINIAELVGQNNNLKVVCINNENGGTDYQGSGDPLVINLSDPRYYNGIDIVVKGRNVILRGSVPTTDVAINLFVDNGNVYLDNTNFANGVEHGPTNGIGNYGVFDAKGNLISECRGNIPSQTLRDIAPGANFNTCNGFDALSARNIFDKLKALGAGDPGVGMVNYGTYIRGNIFVNGILAGNSTVNSGHPGATSNKYYFHGRLASLNTALNQSEKRATLINNLFGNAADDINAYVDFSKVFAWQCQLNGIAADAAGQSTGQPCMVANDLFKFSPFVLINTPINTKLLQ